jgi:glycosyltransferase involved in cell wall biosynthesis
MTAPTTLSVVMPAYNEEGAIADATAEVREWVLDKIPGSELVVVDDGSRDRTGAILDGIAAVDPRVRVIHKPNGGHGPALRTGIDAAAGDRLFLIDSDRQIPLDAFQPLWAAVESGKDAAFGIRTRRQDPVIRLWLTRVVRNVLPLLFGARITDANIPFKLLRRSIWESARPLIPPDTLAPSLFLAVFAAARGFDVAYLPVPHRERQTGTVSIRRWRLLKFCARAFRQLVAFRVRLRG